MEVPGLRLRRGAFVTLEVGGELRGCLGRVTGDRPLGEVVRAMAAAAAREDPRFPPLEPADLTDLRIEVSVLGPPVALAAAEAIAQIVIGRDGLLVRQGEGWGGGEGPASGLLLPQVAPEYDWGPEEFLAAVCRKAGLTAEAWREPGVELFTFSADVFGE
jgi:AmmeMemoRadiSam system protein A